MNLLSMPYTMVELVKKVYYYSGSKIENDNGALIIASMSEEYRLKCREAIFATQLELSTLKSKLDNKDWNISYNMSDVNKINSYLEVMNRCSDQLYPILRDKLRPIWNVYWGESCCGISSIAIWCLKADEDQGQKVFAKLQLEAVTAKQE